MRKREAFQPSIDYITPGSPLRDCVRHALSVRRARLHAVLAAAGIASMSPLALSAAFPPVIPLGSLYPTGGGDGSSGFVLTGSDPGDEAGYSVSAAGDVNGDGIDDVIIGARDGDPGGKLQAGESYVVFGSTERFPAVVPLASLYPAGGGDGSRGFVLTGATAGDVSGWSVHAAGDVNGDGIDDLIVGAAGASPRGTSFAGASYVLFGSRQGFPATVSLGSLYPAGGGDGSRGFVLTGIDANDQSSRVSAAGDVNGDGIDDFIVGAPYADSPRFDAGESYLVFGSTQGFPAVFPLATLYPAGGGDGSRGFVLIGTEEQGHAGFSVSAAGDVNGDGIDDLVIGSPDVDVGEDSAAGESYVVFGSTETFPAIVPLGSLYPTNGGDGSRGFVLTGIGWAALSGGSVSAAGDVNGDGLADLVVGAWRADLPGGAYDGLSYVVFGSTRGFPAIFPLASLSRGDGSNGFVLEGVDSRDYAGRSVSAAGDVNGDGVDDLIIGADAADPDGHASAGESYVVFGSAQGFPAVFPLATLFPDGGGDGSDGFVLTGIRQSDYSGHSVSSAGDLNADGIDDVIIGAELADPNGQSTAGESYVVFGRAAAP